MMRGQRRAGQAAAAEAGAWRSDSPLDRIYQAPPTRSLYCVNFFVNNSSHTPSRQPPPAHTMAIRAALLVAALMVATGAHAQNKVCVLPARIQSGSASVGGKITQPVDADLKPSGNAPFSGNINIVFPQGENPSDSVQKAVR
jgi:hypothetical protein